MPRSFELAPVTPRRSRSAIRSLGLVLGLLLVALFSAGPAYADGSRRIELDAPGGPPSAGQEGTLRVRVTEGDHAVKGAAVTLVAGMGGEHEEHHMGATPASPDGQTIQADPFEVVATEAGEPGVYLARLTFPSDGRWTVLVSAAKGGKVTEMAYEVAVAAPVPAAAPAPAGSAVPGSSESTLSESTADVAAPPVTATDAASSLPGSVEQEARGHDMPGMSMETEPHDDGASGHAEDGDAHVAGGSINWWAISGFLGVIAMGIVGAASLKAHLRRQIERSVLEAVGAENA